MIEGFEDTEGYVPGANFIYVKNFYNDGCEYFDVDFCYSWSQSGQVYCSRNNFATCNHQDGRM